MRSLGSRMEIDCNTATSGPLFRATKTREPSSFKAIDSTVLFRSVMCLIFFSALQVPHVHRFVEPAGGHASTVTR